MWTEFKDDWRRYEGGANDDIHGWNSTMLYTALATQNVSYYNDGPTADKSNLKQAYRNYCLKRSEKAGRCDYSPLDVGPSTRSPLASASNNAV
jgi:hypothetical protein